MLCTIALSAMRGVFFGRNPNEQGMKSASNNGSITNFTAICTTRHRRDAQRPSLSRLSGLRDVNPAHQCRPVPPAPQFLFEFVQKPIFAVFADSINIHLVHSRRPFVGLYPLPGLLQDVLPTDLIVEKREPPFRLLLGHSV